MFENILATIKKEKPLILNITNDVTIDFVANGLLSIGASPVMSKAKQEIEDLMAITNAIVINLGTLDDDFIQLCEHACQIANRFNKPIIFDPVGAGASHYRTQTCLKLMNQYRIAIIRGNASEIMALSQLKLLTKGVDSVIQSEFAIESAQALSSQYDVAIIISGKIDVVVDANQVKRVSGGSAMMPFITGTGCLFSAVVSAFHAVEANRLTAAHAATIFYGMCGEVAAENAQGPGSFKAKFLDALYSLPGQPS